MKTVYMVTSGSYSDYGVNAIFSTKEKAQEYIDLFPDSDCNGVTEIDLDASRLEWKKAGRDTFIVRMLRDGTVELAEPRPLGRSSPSEEIECRIWKRSEARAYAGTDTQDCLSCQVWASDATHAVKIANEKRTQMIALGEWYA